MSILSFSTPPHIHFHLMTVFWLLKQMKKSEDNLQTLTISFLLVCNKWLNPNALKQRAYYVIVSVGWESGHDLPGLSASGFSGGYTHSVRPRPARVSSKALLGRDPLQAHMVVGRIHFLEGSSTEGLIPLLAVRPHCFVPGPPYVMVHVSTASREANQ